MPTGVPTSVVTTTHGPPKLPKSDKGPPYKGALKRVLLRQPSRVDQELVRRLVGFEVGNGLAPKDVGYPTHVSAHVCVHMHMCVHVYIYICIYTKVYIYMYTYTCTYIYYICKYLDVYILICTTLYVF